MAAFQPTDFQHKGNRIPRHLRCIGLEFPCRISHENELSNPVKKELIEDWNDIHGVAKDFGTPEFADHMSGHIFMQGTPIEDKCSKCVRIGDLFHLFNFEMQIKLHICY